MDDVCKLLRRRQEDLALFFFAHGQQRAIHTIDDASACKNFQKLTECIFGPQDINALQMRLIRMRKEFIEAQQTK